MPNRPSQTVCSLVVALALSLLATPTRAETANELDSQLRQNPEAGFFKLLDEADRSWAEVKTFRATFEKEERRGSSMQAKEVMDYKFIRDHCIRMEWIDSENKGKKALFVDGNYNNMLAIATGGWISLRLELSPTDPKVLAKTNHPITESGFGKALPRMRELTKACIAKRQVKIEYGGRVKGPDGQQCLSVTRSFSGGTEYTKLITLFDENNMMPIMTEAHDKSGLLERYTYKGLRLNPALGNRDELTIKDFQRSVVFPEDGDWNPEKQPFTLDKVGKEWLRTHPGQK